MSKIRISNLPVRQLTYIEPDNNATIITREKKGMERHIFNKDYLLARMYNYKDKPFDEYCGAYVDNYLAKEQKPLVLTQNILKRGYEEFPNENYVTRMFISLKDKFLDINSWFSIRKNINSLKKEENKEPETTYRSHLQLFRHIDLEGRPNQLVKFYEIPYNDTYHIHYEDGGTIAVSDSLDCLEFALQTIDTNMEKEERRHPRSLILDGYNLLVENIPSALSKYVGFYQYKFSLLDKIYSLDNSFLKRNEYHNAASDILQEVDKMEEFNFAKNQIDLYYRIIDFGEHSLGNAPRGPD